MTVLFCECSDGNAKCCRITYNDVMEQKIWLFVPTGAYPPDIGGPATYVPLLEKYLPARGFVVDVLPFRVVRFLPKGISHLVYFFFCLRFAWRADIIYAQDALSVGWPAFLASFIFRRPLVVKVVGDHVWEQGRQRFGIRENLDDFALWQLGRPYLFFLRLLQQIVVRWATRIIVPSLYLKKVVLRWGVLESNISLVYNGVEFATLTKEPSGIMAHPLIVTIARLTPWKGIEGIIETVSHERSWHVAIIGDGPHRNELERLARKNNIHERIRFLGQLPKEEALGWCKVADVFVLNSSYEGLPHTLIEAMAVGTPVVATDIPGNREVVTHGVDGFLVPVGNSGALRGAIEETLNDNKETKRRIDAARARAKEFSVDKTITGLAGILKSL